MSAASQPFDVEASVKERYAAGAVAREESLCCPVDYDPRYLKVIPAEILERDYGCGDPSKFVEQGETVLDLGSGGGKICYILAQKVGSEGRVIGVDLNDTMLELARRHQPAIARAVGYDNVRFLKGRIQDLSLDLAAADAWLATHPVTNVESWSAFEAACARLRREQPLVADDSVDVIVSNCVLNLVETSQKQRLFAEMFRVLKRGGRAVISDIVCDEDPTPTILNDPDLWSGCIAGAFREDVFLRLFEEAGFHGIEIVHRGDAPWRTVDGIEFRSMTVRAYKGKQGPCVERNQAVIYKGPWKQVHDDDGHVYPRGERMAVCDKTYRLLTDPNGPYAGLFAAVDPRETIPLEDAEPFNCRHSARRHPRVTKGLDYHATTDADPNACCGPEGCC